MKKAILMTCLIGIFSIGLAGCSSTSNKSSSTSSSKVQSSQSDTSSTQSSSSDHSASSYPIKGQKALRIRYENVDYSTRLDNEYREEQIYQQVPGKSENNRVFHWDQLNISDQQKVYVDKKAVATFKDNDDPHDYDHEDYYRISFSKHAQQKYWVGDDVIEREANEGYDD